jgi:hypothetical protein
MNWRLWNGIINGIIITWMVAGVCLMVWAIKKGI